MTELHFDADRLEAAFAEAVSTVGPSEDRFDFLASPTSMFIRAKDPETGRFKNADIYYLTKESLLNWLRDRAGNNPWAEDVVGILLGHGSLHGGAARVFVLPETSADVYWFDDSKTLVENWEAFLEAHPENKALFNLTVTPFIHDLQEAQLTINAYDHAIEAVIDRYGEAEIRKLFDAHGVPMDRIGFEHDDTD